MVNIVKTKLTRNLQLIRIQGVEILGVFINLIPTIRIIETIATTSIAKGINNLLTAIFTIEKPINRLEFHILVYHFIVGLQLAQQKVRLVILQTYPEVNRIFIRMLIRMLEIDTDEHRLWLFLYQTNELITICFADNYTRHSRFLIINRIIYLKILDVFIHIVDNDQGRGSDLLGEDAPGHKRTLVAFDQDDIVGLAG